MGSSKKITEMKKITDFLFKLLSVIPFIWLLIFFSYVLRVSISIGRMPIYDNPQSGNYSFHFKFLNIFFEIVGLSFFAYLIILIIYRIYFKHSFEKKYIYLWLIGYSIIFILFVFDPYGLIKWWVD